MILLYVLLTSCELIEFHPYDIRKSSHEQDINPSNIARIEAMDDNKDTIRFAYIGDTQRFYDETAAFVKEVNQHRDIDFVIHGGDITDFGLSKEYIWIHDILKELRVPYVALVGNHDMIGHGKEIYRNIYGEFNFSFKFRNTSFICLNTNGLEADDDIPIPDLGFMSGFISDTADVERTIVVMHAPPFDTQFDGEAVVQFRSIIENYNNLLFYLHAHVHHLTVNEYFKDGIKFYGCDDISGRNYMLFTIVGKSYTYRVVYF